MHGEEPWSQAKTRGLPPDALLLVCHVDLQRLDVRECGQIVARYVVSTSALGVGCAAQSFRTPTGWHAVRERIGAGQPPGAVFRDRQPTGEVLPESRWCGGTTDLILTRILWLDGLEKGVNSGPDCDSHARFIYLHGTNREDLLGRAASGGCIRLGNRDMLQLFERVADRPAWCHILPPAS
jgi:UDP-N-acetylmuramate--alanine ligase